MRSLARLAVQTRAFFLAAVILPIAAAPAAEAQQPPDAPNASAQSESARATLRAVRTTEPPNIDGRLSDEMWAKAPAADHFTQRDPDEGQPATERTEVRVLYDDDAIYVGVRLYDSEPARVSRRVTARDEHPDADAVTIFLDPRHDHRTGVTFTVTAAGSHYDSVLSNDTFQDASWNAVWLSAIRAIFARGAICRVCSRRVQTTCFC